MCHAPGMAVSKAPAGLPDDLWSTARLRCLWVEWTHHSGLTITRQRSLTARRHAMSHTLSLSHAATPQAATICCPGTLLAGRISTAPHNVHGGFSIAPAQMSLQPPTEGKAQRGAPSGRAVLNQRRPRTERRRCCLNACASIKNIFSLPWRKGSGVHLPNNLNSLSGPSIFGPYSIAPPGDLQHSSRPRHTAASALRFRGASALPVPPEEPSA